MEACHRKAALGESAKFVVPDLYRTINEDLVGNDDAPKVVIGVHSEVSADIGEAGEIERGELGVVGHIEASAHIGEAGEIERSELGVFGHIEVSSR